MAQVTMTGQEYVELMEEVRTLRTLREFYQGWLIPEITEFGNCRAKTVEASKSSKVYVELITEAVVENILKNPAVCSHIVSTELYGWNTIEQHLSSWYSWCDNDGHTVNLSEHPKWATIKKIAAEYDKTKEAEADAELAAAKALEAMEAMEQEQYDVLPEVATTQEDEDEEE